MPAKSYRIVNLPGKTFTPDRSYNQYSGKKNSNQILFVQPPDIEPEKAYPTIPAHYFYLATVCDGEIDSVEALKEAFGIAWLLEENFSFPEINKPRR
jgi:hypothetical protein